jgi:hypothetical protein
MLQSGLFIQMVLHRANESWPRVHVYDARLLHSRFTEIPLPVLGYERS